MQLGKKEIQKFQKEILEWYAENQRALPWRDAPVKTSSSGASLRDPYKILISEVMSQQTQISRVVPKYLAWIERFPTLQSLAEAPTSEVLRYWNGLGYNRRALYLQRLAKELVKETKGTKETEETKVMWPKTEEELRKLHGIGEYTARAILCFAFNKQVAVVDTNVRKVILVFLTIEDGKWKIDIEGGKKKLERKSTNYLQSSRSTLNNLPSTIKDKDMQNLAQQLLPEGRAYEWNQALMDYAGAMLKEHKIPVPRQSHFKTSNRFYRGQVIRMLLKSPETIDSAFQKLENNGITKEKFGELIRQMEKEGMVNFKKGSVSLP